MRLFQSFLFIFLFIFSFNTVNAQVVQSLVYAHDAKFGFLDVASSNPILSDVGNATVPVDIEGVVHVTNPVGDLLFYATGQGIFRADGTQMTNLTPMISDEGITEIVVTQVPGIPQRYFVVYTAGEGCDKLYYLTVDMSVNNGLGDIYNVNNILSDTTNTSGDYAEGKEIIEIPNSANKMLIVRRCDFGFESFLISQAGITNRQGIRPYNNPVINNNELGRGELDYHNERIAYACRERDEVVSFNFNPCNQSSSGAFFDYPLNGAYGVEFSSTANYLYASSEIPALGNLIKIQTGTINYSTLSIDTIQSCNSTTVNNVGLGQLERLGNNKIYTPIIGECRIAELNNIDDNITSYNLLDVDDKMKPGLSDIVQSKVSLQFLQYNLIITPVSCKGDKDGKAAISIEGGMPPYDIEWFDNTNNYTKNNLAAGNYSLKIKDASCANNVINVNVYIPEPDSLKASVEVEDAECWLGNGEFNKEIVGGTPPYTIAYSGGFSDVNPKKGNYIMFVTDDRGCNVSVPFSIDSPDKIEWTDTIIQPLCYGEKGTYIVSGMKGGFGDKYINKTIDSVFYFKAGSHTITVRDDNLCEIKKTIIVTQPEELQIEVEYEQEDCNVFKASATATTSGGTGEVEVEWLGIDPDSFFPGKHSVKATDENGCEVYEFFTFNPKATIVEVPTAFSPNGDGLNEYFIPIFNCERDFNYSVYSRWGIPVFESSEKEKRWFGFDKNNNKVQKGVYVYTLEYIDSRGLTHSKKGTVLVNY